MRAKDHACLPSRRKAIAVLGAVALTRSGVQGASAEQILKLTPASPQESLLRVIVTSELIAVVWRDRPTRTITTHRLACYTFDGDMLWDKTLDASMPVVDLIATKNGRCCLVYALRGAGRLIYEELAASGEITRRQEIAMDDQLGQFVAVAANGRFALLLSASNLLVARPFGADADPVDVSDVFSQGVVDAIPPRPVMMRAINDDNLALVDQVNAKALVLSSDLEVVRRRNLGEVSPIVQSVLETQASDAERRNSRLRARGSTVVVSVATSVGRIASDMQSRLWLAPSRWNLRAASFVALDSTLSNVDEVTLTLPPRSVAGDRPPVALAATPSRLALGYQTGTVVIYGI